jgi:hypothetical protein
MEREIHYHGVADDQEAADGGNALVLWITGTTVEVA